MLVLTLFKEVRRIRVPFGFLSTLCYLAKLSCFWSVRACRACVLVMGLSAKIRSIRLHLLVSNVTVTVYTLHPSPSHHLSKLSWLDLCRACMLVVGLFKKIWSIRLLSFCQQHQSCCLDCEQTPVTILQTPVTILQTPVTILQTPVTILQTHVTILQSCHVWFVQGLHVGCGTI